MTTFGSPRCGSVNKDLIRQRPFLSLAISSNKRGMSCLALATKSWSAVVPPINSISPPRFSPVPVLIKLFPLAWSRPSMKDFHGPGVALSHRRRISCNSTSSMRLSRPFIFNPHLLGFGRLAQVFRGLRLGSLQFGNQVFLSPPCPSPTAITRRAVLSLPPATYIDALQTVTRPSLRVAQSLP